MPVSACDCEHCAAYPAPTEEEPSDEIDILIEEHDAHARY